MKTVMMGLLVLVLLSCNSRSGERLSRQMVDTSGITRIVVLETNTVTFCFLNKEERKIFRTLDTVWFNTRTHKVDDVDTTAMKAVLYIVAR